MAEIELDKTDELMAALGRMPHESGRALRALVDYAMMGMSRGLYGLSRRYQGGDAGEPPTTSLRVLERWSSKFEWGRRAAAWDQVVEARRVAKWTARVEELNEIDYQTGKKLRDLAMAAFRAVAMEDVPLTAVADALIKASKLQRLATNEPTENTQLSGAALAAAIERELARVAGRSAAGYADGAEADADTGE